MRILITGGAGFIGSHIADEALAQGHSVVIVDDLSNGRIENVPKQAKFYQTDILSDEFRRWVQDEKPQVIYHEAAQPSLRKSIDDPASDAMVNIVGTLHVLQAAQAVNAHLMFASTSAVYAPNAPVPFFEPDKQHPNLPYGIAKYASEMYIQNAGISYTILRYGNVYGPRQAPIGENQLVPHCIRFLRGLEPDFCINGDGEQMRDFIYVKDIAQANLMVRSQGIYNCATGQGTTVNTICRKLAVIAGKPHTEFKHGPAKLGEARNSILATQLIKHSGWRAQVSLDEGLRQTWESYGKGE